MSTTFRFTLRTDSAADWQAKNPVLSKGEPGLEEVGDGTFRQKVGDGVTAWADLPYVGAATDAQIAAVAQQVATKADEQSVADRLAAKANAASLAAKADKTYVDTEVGTRATKAEVAPALPAAVDRNSGAVLRHKLATNQNCVWAHLGDSTANGTDEWLYLALDRLRLDYPNMRVTHELWNDTTQAYDAATVLQAGTSEDEPASSFFDGFGRTGTLVGSSTETGAAQWQGGSSAGSTDGSAWQYAGFAGWFNHTMDPKAPEGIIGRVVATLAAGTTSTASLRLSILGDGSTGTDELMVGIGQNANSITYSVYWRDGQTANMISTGSGNVIAVDNSVPRKVELSLALKGTAVTATLKLLDGSGRTSTGTGTLTAPSTWAGFGKKAFRIHGGATIPVDSVSLGLMGKDPATLRVINGSMPGANLTYFQAAGRIAKMLPVDADLLTLASSHNHGTQAVAAYVQQVKDTLDQYALPLVPSAGVVLVSQNPQFAPIAQANQDAHLARLRAIKPLAKERGYGYIAGVEEFLKQADRGKSATNADGVHPIAAGSALWRDAALRFLRGDTGKADRTYVDTEVGTKLDTTVASATYAAPAATVHATAGQGSHQTLQAAIDALHTAGRRGLIEVRSNLTITAPIVLKRQVEIVFRDNATIFNNGPAGTDTFQSSVPVGVAGEVQLVTLRNPNIQRDPSKTDRAGAAINFHGAFGWKVYAPLIDGHAVGLRFDASPYPSGQGSHSTVYDPNITRCDVGIYNTGSANINQVYNPHIHSTTLPIWHESGLNLVVAAARIENLGAPGPVTTELVRVDAPRLFMPFMHIEGERSANPIKVNAGGSIFGHGDVYVYNGGGPSLAVIDPQAGPCDLNLSNAGRTLRSAVKPEKVVRTTANATSVDFVTEYVGYDTVGGAEVSVGGPRSDRVWRITPRSTEPATGTLATGDFGMFTLPSGITVPRVRDGVSWRQLMLLSQTPTEKKLPDVSVSGTVKTVHRALNAQTLSSLVIIPDAFIAYAATDYWTVAVEEWNGNAKAADIASWTQAAQVPLSATSISLSNYALAVGRHVRLRFTATGAPPAWVSPMVQLIYTLA